MPKDTFYNLREDKKNRIIDICLEEFANNEYAIVSISKIVKRAEIAKGSFYQYFDNKLDLYRYIISYISDKKRGYLMSNYEGDGDFYDELKSSIIMGAKFCTEYPQYAQILERLMKSDNELKNKVLGDIHTGYTQTYKSLVFHGVEMGAIREGLDASIVSTIIYGMLNAVDQYFSEKGMLFDHDKLSESIDKVIDVLKNGIGKDIV